MAYTYVARTRLMVGDGFREPGELVPEANSWANAAAYVSSGQLERYPIATKAGESMPLRTYPTYAPPNYDELVATPEPPEAQRVAVPDGHELVCMNCEAVNYLDDEHPEVRPWRCWQCRQVQTISQAREAQRRDRMRWRSIL